jgi:hypothetical protein
MQNSETGRRKQTNGVDEHAQPAEMSQQMLAAQDVDDRRAEERYGADGLEYREKVFSRSDVDLLQTRERRSPEIIR